MIFSDLTWHHPKGQLRNKQPSCVGKHNQVGPNGPTFVEFMGHTCWPWDVFFSPSHWWQEQTMTRLEKCQPIRNVDWNIGYIFSTFFAPLNSAAQMLSIKHPCGTSPKPVPSKEHPSYSMLIRFALWSRVWIEINWLSKLMIPNNTWPQFLPPWEFPWRAW